MNRLTIIMQTNLMFALVLAAGCQKPVHFPAESMQQDAASAGALRAYDTDGNGKADFYMFADSSGRINRTGFASSGQTSASQPAVVDITDLDSIPPDQCRHLFIILDGFGYDVLKKFYDDGGLRVFYPPSRVIAPYPCLTDLCIEDILGYVPCLAFESLYYDRQTGKTVGGNDYYMAGKNQPYNQLLQYRSDTIWDAIGFIYPQDVFGKELNDLKRVLDRNQTREVRGYMVSSAGISTKFGADGQRKALIQVERLVNQVVRESRGKIKITLAADHGHSYTPSTQIPLDQYLKEKGWRIADRLEKPTDVAYIRYGLETYASFCTQRAAKLAEDLIQAPGVLIASYRDGDSVVVLAKPQPPASQAAASQISQPTGTPAFDKAVIRCKDSRYSYHPAGGDPLQLSQVLANLKADADGFYDHKSLFEATVMHIYPDSLERLWRAHTSIAQNIPDVIVSLENNFYSGSSSFGGMVKIASTHGSIDRSNSTTFIMSTIGPLPPAMRSANVPENMSKLLGEKWPLGIKPQASTQP
ncbi:MAG: hypothetical protein HZA50_06015 [Planctomycetes bacterium]|nr:hypothetical protein [Planctomycetota bacterium]